jgi:zinc transporter ZupT
MTASSNYQLAIGNCQLNEVLPAAGAMFYVVVEELIPEASSGQHSNLSTIGFAIGFVLMMVLDVVMG